MGSLLGQDVASGLLSLLLYGCICHFKAALFLGFIEPPHEKTCLWGLQPGKTQTGLLSYRDYLES